jgi:hypothetical protein
MAIKNRKKIDGRLLKKWNCPFQRLHADTALVENKAFRGGWGKDRQSD